MEPRGGTLDADSHIEHNLFQVKKGVETLELRGGPPNSDSCTEYDLYQIKTERRAGPLEVQLSVDKQLLTMELDTGAAVTLISESTCQRLWPERPLQACTRRLRTYSGEEVPVLGQLDMVLECGDQSTSPRFQSSCS